jgi:hypothetical protein
MRRGSPADASALQCSKSLSVHSVRTILSIHCAIAVVLQHGSLSREPLEFHGEDGLKDRQETGTGSILFLTGTILWWLAEKYAVSPLRDNELSLIGMVYQKQKNTPAARKQLQRTLQLNPNFPQADKIRKTLNKINS